MSFLQNRVYSPWFSLLVLLGLMVGYAVLYGVLVQLFAPAGALELSQTSRHILYIILGGSTIFTFLLPAISLQAVERDVEYFPGKLRADPISYLRVLFFLVVFSPVMQIVGDWNAGLSLPESMRTLEHWMRTQEDAMAELTAKMVMVDRVPLLLMNLLVMAVLPAVAEEFFFRGNLMHIMQRMLGNPHLSIWITAIIFSAIHFQFYGFFPRMLLGAFFGYMMVWTKNIWVPVAAHFINNAFVTILAFYYAKQGKTFSELQTSETYSVFVYIGGLVLSAMVGYYFYRYTAKRQGTYGTRMD